MERKRFSVRIGVNPIAWSNDDLPWLGGETPLEVALAEGRAIGYEGFELGHKFPREPEALGAVLARHQLALVSGWYSGGLARRSVEEEIAAVGPHLRLLEENGARVLVYGETADSIQGAAVPLYKRPRFLRPEQWRAYGDRLTAFARYTQSRGVRLAYHHHMGAYVEAPEDVDRLMAHTGEEVGLLLDTGHVTFAGGDPVALAARHATRICHVHCKDVRLPVARIAHNRQWSFLEGVLSGVFAMPGDGSVDFRSVLRILFDRGYQGWLVVEAEQDPAVAPSYASAQRGFHYLSDIVRELENGATAPEAA
jgi:inosose dehydratase